MFCSECGKEISESAKFCPECGSSLKASERVPDSPELPGSRPGEPILTFRPVFVPNLTLLSVIPFQIFFAIWMGGFLGIAGFMLLGVVLELPTGVALIPAVLGALLGFIGLPVLVFIARKRTYADTEYRFYRDRLEYAEGFWTAENKSIKYDRIAEISLRRGVIQKRFGLGTIYLGTPATGYAQGGARSGILLRDIADPGEAYERVKELVG
jgi:membrane protein YdbS with pleckstrin-like domain